MEAIIRQFRHIKTMHPDALLLFRSGDFYKCYNEDAENASRILGIMVEDMSVTEDDGQTTKMTFSEFPHYALDTYLPKLIRAGHRIAICDQLEAPKPTVKRGITELVTPANP